MADAPGHEVTRILEAWRHGDDEAPSRLFPLLYDELRAMARRHLRGERPNHTLQPTALVHEAYLRLLPRQRVAARDRVQFLGLAAQAIRRVLVDHARAKARLKRGGRRLRVTLSGREPREDPLDVDLLDLDRALRRLGEADALNRKVVELRFFGGLTELETAEVLAISQRTVRRRWVLARSWLFRELEPESPAEEP